MDEHSMVRTVVKLTTVLVVAGVVALLGWSLRNASVAVALPAQATAAYATVRIPDRGYEARVEVARTPEERVRGLSGRPSLDRGTGVLFVFDILDQHRIWMKDMRFSIDLIWIAGGIVVDTHERLPVPPEGADPRTLPYFNPRPQALLAIEVPAGTVSEFGIGPGQRVEIVFDNP